MTKNSKRESMVELSQEDVEKVALTDPECFDAPTPPVPPDGGWGWVIVAASMLANIIVDGVCFSFGVFYVEFLDYFKESKSKTAWVGSLVPGMYLAMGPFAAALANKYSCRVVTIIGSVLASFFFFLSTFAPNVDALIVIYGILGGMSFGLMYLPSIIIVSFYFEKKRAFANGIAVAGSGIGTFVFAPLTTWLIRTYGWKGANWIIAAIILNGVACGAIYRPLKPTVTRYRKQTQSESDEAPKKCTIIQNIIEDKARARTVSSGSLDGKIITRENIIVKDTDCAEITDKTAVKFLEIDNQLSNGTLTASLDNVGRNRTISNSSAVYKQVLISQQNNRNPDTASQYSSKRSLNREEQERLKEYARPMYREDIFLTGSVRSLNEYKQNPNGYTASVTNIPLPPTVAEKKQNPCCAKLAPACHVIQKTFDISLFKSATFNILCCASVLAMTGFFTPFVYIAQRALVLNVKVELATFLISIIGIANIVGRILSGWVSDRPWADCLVIHNVALIIGGAATMAVPWLPNYPLLAVYCSVFGLCIAAYIGLRSMVLVSVLGINKLSSSFGLLLLFQGIASIIGSPLMGTFYDLTQSLTVSFLVSGALISLAGIICLPIRRIAKWENSP